MKKKVLSLVLTAAMMTTMLAGCGSSDNGSTAASTGEAPAAATTEAAAASTEAAPAEEVTLKWAIWDQETTQYWGDIKDAYEASHPGVTIEMVDLGSTDYMTVLATELSGSGSDFDVVTVKDVPGYATLVQKGSILSLDDYISKDGVDLSKYAGVTDQVTVDGSLYELPFRNDFWVLFYNKDLFDAKGVAINWSEDVDVSITGNSTNPTRFQHPVAGTYKKERIAAGKPYFSVASGGGTGRTLHPDNMAAGPASYGMTDTMGRMHSDAQFAGSSSVPAHVEMMGFLGMGNNPMVGATVAIAVAIDLAINKK